MSDQPRTVANREAFYDRLGAESMAPLWSVLHDLVTPQPVTRCQPVVWHYDRIRPFIMEAGELITAEEAERRVLILENPGMPGESRITPSLYAGLQLILPGEVAPAHRHTQSALRFIVEGVGAYTSVEGEKTLMHPGDFVITPSWTWHDHGNDTDEPMVWLDGLDIPVSQFLGTSFAEKLAQKTQPLERPEGHSLARFGNGLLPFDDVSDRSGPSSSPVFNYPYERTRQSLTQLGSAGDIHPVHGIKLKYTNPVNGDYAIPTMATFMQWLPEKFDGRFYQSTDATVLSVVEGRGRSIVGETVLEWRAKDTFVIPSWIPHRHITEEEAVLFSFSDRPIQQKLGLWREKISE